MLEWLQPLLYPSFVVAQFDNLFDMANKTKTIWYCNNCGADSPRWEGRCPACGEWNTMIEERSSVKNSKSGIHRPSSKINPQKITEIQALETPRITLPSAELNRVLGGGLVPGSITLIGGEPGIGKSTLILQNLLSIRSRTILYISGEESPQQLRMRADRIGRLSDNLLILCDTDLNTIIDHINAVELGIVIIDSIQTIASPDIESTAGSVSQVRECSARLQRYAKESGTPVILIGHINKDGNIAGPKVLEHIVDTVLQFEGDRQYMYRILRSIKNRFGSTAEIGIYEMASHGLREVTNPSQLLISQHSADLSGTAIGITLEGLRPFLIEAQALVSTAAYGTPQRSVTGFDAKRLNMLLAVLEKRVGFRLVQKDVFLNIAGGLRVNDPALDLSVICAILSSNVDIPIPPSTCLSGEVGLTGEIRPVTRIEQRILEAQRLGFTAIIVPAGNLKGIDTTPFTITIHEVAKVEEAVRLLFA